MELLTTVVAYSHTAPPRLFPAGTPVVWRVDCFPFDYFEVGFAGGYSAVVAQTAVRGSAGERTQGEREATARRP